MIRLLGNTFFMRLKTTYRFDLFFIVAVHIETIKMTQTSWENTVEYSVSGNFRNVLAEKIVKMNKSFRHTDARWLIRIKPFLEQFLTYPIKRCMPVLTSYSGCYCRLRSFKFESKHFLQWYCCDCHMCFL